MIHRNDWEAVYANQKKLLKVLSGIDDIFLGGGTAIQCYTIPMKYRESEDLDFFVDHVMDKGEGARINRTMVDALRKTDGIELMNSTKTEDGTHRTSWGIDENDEIIKIELLDFTDARYGDLDFVKHEDFPRIENNYNLLLYKLKALCDRQDTIKDLFDIYFIFKELEPIPIKTMLIDLRQKFEESTGYIYDEKHLARALDLENRNWDIVPTDVTKIYWDYIKIAVDEFRIDFLKQLLDPLIKYFDFTFETYIKTMANQNDCEPEDFINFFEANPFIEAECKKRI